ncbi:DUF2750 domain-containing protein [Alkalihalobacillus sp. TS-13]|uniref:DUF2750 domain-containing protein n=1 Tax=Alkalihalobacillus sp. TS-13 TaxID=2842455 RepID=UPI001C88760D|nr:DUF2750 domain-containing protein [Alkalihalobacillus sp. TS-13]
MEFEAVSKQSANIRYEYFIKKVVDYEEVWGLYNDGWATSQDEESKMLIPFFPRKEFAESCIRKEWAGYKAKLIDLDEFINEWPIGMKEGGIRPSIFPNEENTVVVNIEVLIKDLETELENY